MRILVVDDQEDVLAVVGKMLNCAGHETVLISDVALELPKVEAEEFDAMITDMLMPDMDGTEVIKRFRQRHPNLWIVAMSGGGQLPAGYALGLAEAFGANRILCKPFSQTELLSAVEPSFHPRDSSHPQLSLPV